jgi:hypothetical protein
VTLEKTDTLFVPTTRGSRINQAYAVKLSSQVRLQARGNQLVFLSRTICPHFSDLRGRAVALSRPDIGSTPSDSLNIRHTCRLVCIYCDTLGIVLDYAEGPPMSPIKCRGCGGFSGTLAGLRHMALPEQKDVLDVDE